MHHHHRTLSGQSDIRRVRLLCVSIEASGDRLLAETLIKLQSLGKTPYVTNSTDANDRHLPRVNFDLIGIGGAKSQGEGLESLLDPSSLAAHGFTEALRVLPATILAWRLLKRLAQDVDAYLLVDAPELNMRLLRWVKTHRDAKIRRRPVFYIAPPQAWAWRPHRAQTLQLADQVYCLFPFATDWYRARGVPAHYVGHPLRSINPTVTTSPKGLARSDQETEIKNLSSTITLALFPGSRTSSLNRALPLMLQSCMLMLEQRDSASNLALNIYVAETSWISLERYNYYYDHLRHLLNTRGWIQSSPGQWRSPSGGQLAWEGRSAAESPVPKSTPHPALHGADLALCYAGTSTLESALSGVPPITISPLSRLSTFITRHHVSISHCALPNLILGREGFPELPPWKSDVREVSQTLSMMIDRYQDERCHHQGELASALQEVQLKLIHFQGQKIAELMLREI